MTDGPLGTNGSKKEEEPRGTGINTDGGWAKRGAFQKRSIMGTKKGDTVPSWYLSPSPCILLPWWRKSACPRVGNWKPVTDGLWGKKWFPKKISKPPWVGVQHICDLGKEGGYSKKNTPRQTGNGSLQWGVGLGKKMGAVAQAEVGSLVAVC